ncbi:MAG: mannose-1-phosphate guanylyltransferase/mannose-6-phosphate isomerase [Nitrospiraceae bacterium]|nr:mannose-1-phosphate guanylyltransferase/mannose-6-phosphate isomerase [Nitrospiraceae bacterium]
MKKTAASGKRNLYAVIMAGGKGTRFWPLSRENFPKQFLRITGEKSLLQHTVERLGGLVQPRHFMIITAGKQNELVRWQTDGVLPPAAILSEPEGKNTAPAIALAAFRIHKKDKDAIMLVMPSDHHIKNPDGFADAVRKAAPSAAEGWLVTFGVVPTRPETGYGYIQAGKKMPGGAFKVESFIEKPDRKTADALIKKGSVYWNSGIFMFSAKAILSELKAHMPALYSAFAKIEKYLGTAKEAGALETLYKTLEPESIDYGVMEQSRKVVVQAVDFGWSDIGSWNALEEILEKDENGNVISGNALAVGSKGSILMSSGRLIASLGLEDMVVIDTADAILVCPKERAQDVRKVVDLLKSAGREEYILPRTEERPWGHFSVLEKGPSYQIKHICLKPKARLSLQAHNHRSEHWIVVSGTAKVQRGEEVFYVHRNESTYIAPTVKHRLENPGLIPLKIIEIQSGEHLGEEDIVRFDDIYGRNTV